MPVSGNYSNAPTTIVNVIDCDVEGNSWVAKEAPKGTQYPFYYFDFRRAGGVYIGEVRASENTIANVDKSATDPSYFGIFHMDTYEIENQGGVEVFTNSF